MWSGFIVDMIFLDFSKAFDIVDHSIALIKLHMLGVDGKLLLWVCGFLVGRTMCVRACAHQKKFGEIAGRQERVKEGGAHTKS